jgi:limonene-1,2-epoxide hydrolase
MTSQVAAFCDLYSKLDARGCEQSKLLEVYAPDVLFVDPFHRIEGREALCTYLHNLYQGVNSCRFDFKEQWVREGSAVLTWTMFLSHPKLRSGKMIQVEGASVIEFNERISQHRDYFDAGQMLYENIPLLGKLVRIIKERL